MDDVNTANLAAQIKLLADSIKGLSGDVAKMGALNSAMLKSSNAGTKLSGSMPTSTETQHARIVESLKKQNSTTDSRVSQYKGIATGFDMGSAKYATPTTQNRQSFGLSQSIPTGLSRDDLWFKPINKSLARNTLAWSLLTMATTMTSMASKQGKSLGGSGGGFGGGGFGGGDGGGLPQLPLGPDKQLDRSFKRAIIEMSIAAGATYAITRGTGGNKFNSGTAAATAATMSAFGFSPISSTVGGAAVGQGMEVIHKSGSDRATPLELAAPGIIRATPGTIRWGVNNFDKLTSRSSGNIIARTINAPMNMAKQLMTKMGMNVAETTGLKGAEGFLARNLGRLGMVSGAIKGFGVGSIPGAIFGRLGGERVGGSIGRMLMNASDEIALRTGSQQLGRFANMMRGTSGALLEAKPGLFSSMGSKIASSGIGQASSRLIDSAGRATRYGYDALRSTRLGTKAVDTLGRLAPSQARNLALGANPVSSMLKPVGASISSKFASLGGSTALKSVGGAVFNKLKGTPFLGAAINAGLSAYLTEGTAGRKAYAAIGSGLMGLLGDRIVKGKGGIGGAMAVGGASAYGQHKMLGWYDKTYGKDGKGGLAATYQDSKLQEGRSKGVEELTRIQQAKYEKLKQQQHTVDVLEATSLRDSPKVRELKKELEATKRGYKWLMSKATTEDQSDAKAKQEIDARVALATSRGVDATMQGVKNADLRKMQLNAKLNAKEASKEQRSPDAVASRNADLWHQSITVRTPTVMR
jgi:hypothetical protein